MKKVKVVALKPFSTSDASGVVTAKKGDELIIYDYTAKRLILSGHVRKYRTKEKQNG